MQKLKEILGSLSEGEITDEDLERLQPLLADSWDSFEGSEQKNMEGNKLYGRMEDVLWYPPLLSFTIERHGGTVMGSTRASMHQWTLDIDKGTAEFSETSYRQLKPRQKKLDTETLARDIANKIYSGKTDPLIKRAEDGTIKIVIGKIIPALGPKQTVAERRKRFRKQLTLLLKKDFEEIRANLYRLR